MRDKNVPKLSHKAYESFTYHLSVRALKAGQMISQRELVSLTGLPLGAIRELIPRLEAEGLIRTIPQRGMSIAEVDPKLVKDAFEKKLKGEAMPEEERVLALGDEAPGEERTKDEHIDVAQVVRRHHKGPHRRLAQGVEPYPEHSQGHTRPDLLAPSRHGQAQTIDAELPQAPRNHHKGRDEHNGQHDRETPEMGKKHSTRIHEPTCDASPRSVQLSHEDSPPRT